MRITELMPSQQLIAELNQITQTLTTEQEQLASGKSLSSPSDNPGAISQDLGVRWALLQNQTYTQAAQNGQSFQSATDGALGQLESLLQTAHTVAEQGLSGTLSSSQLSDLAAQVKQLNDAAASLANTQYGSQYVFAGPYGAAPVNFTTDTWQVPAGQSTAPQPVTVGQGVTVPVGADGTALFATSVGVTAGGVAEPPLLSTATQPGVLAQLQADLASGNVAALSQDLQNVQDALSRVNTVRADVGARSNRLSAAISMLQAASVQLTSQKANLEDTNFTQVAATLSLQETVYQAALAVGAKLLLPTLADYLGTGSLG